MRGLLTGTLVEFISFHQPFSDKEVLTGDHEARQQVSEILQYCAKGLGAELLKWEPVISPSVLCICGILYSH